MMIMMMMTLMLSQMIDDSQIVKRSQANLKKKKIVGLNYLKCRN